MTQEPVESWKGNDGFHQPDFAERRIERFAQSINGQWIFCLKNDDDDETNWYFLTEEVLHDLASQKQKIREEESDKMANAIEMSKQGWIEEGKQKQIEEMCEMLEGMKVRKEGLYGQPVRTPSHEETARITRNATLDDILTKLKEGALNKK